MSKIKKFLFIFLILLFSSLMFPINVLGFDDLDYEFQRDLLFEESNQSINSSFNLREQGAMVNGTYPATFSFTDEIDEASGLGIDFIDVYEQPSDTIAKIIPLLDTHKKVLNMTDANNGDTILFQNNFSSVSFGTLEYWIQIDDVNTESYLRLRNDAQMIFRMRTNTGNYEIQDNIGFQVLDSITNDVWFHIRVDFECTGGSYMALSQYEMEIYQNGVSQGVFDFVSNELSINNLQFHTNTVDEMITYYDAFGYSWGLTSERILDDFSDESDEQEPMGWTINNDVNTFTNVSTDTLDGNTNYLQVYDNNVAGIANLSRAFSDIIIQFDVALSDPIAVNDGNVLFYENGVLIADLRFSGNDVFFHDGGFYATVKLNWIASDNFKIVRIVFDHDANTADIYLEGVLEGNDMDFRSNSVSGIDTLEIVTSDNPVFLYEMFFDNIGYPYFIRDNLIPLRELDGFREVDKYEFALSEVNTLRVLGSSSYGTWTESDSGGNDKVKIALHPTETNNRAVEIGTNNIGDVKGLVKNNFSSTDEFIQITMSFEFFNFGIGTTSYHIIVIEASDASTIIGFIMWHNGSLGYIGGIGGSGIPLRDDLITGTQYEMSIILDYELDIFILDWFIDGVYDETYIQELIYTNKNGLNEIFIRSHWVDNLAMWRINNVGVYENGVSESKELAWASFSTNNALWNSKEQNIFTIISNGFTQLGMTTYPYSISFGSDFADVGNAFSQHFENISYVRNSIEDGLTILTESQPVFFILGGGFNFSFISIEGVFLVEGLNEYRLEFESTNVNIDESYFFVDTNNRLQFRHFADDTNLEFIQARFNIADVQTNGTVISFKTVRSNNAFGYFRLNFTTTSQLFEITPSVKSRKVIISQNKILRDLVILITDNDDNTVSGLTTGYITEIGIEALEGIETTVLTINLVQMMVPLIMILIPTLAISGIYGKKLIIPLFVLMSSICVITGIIPIWLFFIIIISTVSFVFIRKKGI